MRLICLLTSSMCCSSAAARGAEAPLLARKRYESIELAGVAVKSQEAVGENPACEVRAQLLLDETEHRMLAFASACEEGFELLANDGVQLGLFRVVSFVAPRRSCGAQGGTRAGSGDLGRHSRSALREVYRAPGESLERAGSFAGSGQERAFTPRTLQVVHAGSSMEQSCSRSCAHARSFASEANRRSGRGAS